MTGQTKMLYFFMMFCLVSNILSGYNEACKIDVMKGSFVTQYIVGSSLPGERFMLIHLTLNLQNWNSKKFVVELSKDYIRNPKFLEGSIRHIFTYNFFCLRSTKQWRNSSFSGVIFCSSNISNLQKKKLIITLLRY